MEEGLAAASAEGACDSFDSLQRQLLAAVQRASARESGTSSAAAVQEALRKLFPNAYMCGKCGFGPVDHVACTDLRRCVRVVLTLLDLLVQKYAY